MWNKNKNIDAAEAARRKAEYEAKYITHTEPTTPKLEPEPEPEPELFSSMNEVYEADSNLLRNTLITIFGIIILIFFKACQEYIKHR
jgi:hypothetical protein